MVSQSASQFPWVIDEPTRSRLEALASGQNDPNGPSSNGSASAVEVMATALACVPFQLPATRDGANHLADRLARVPCAAPIPLLREPLIIDIGAGDGLSSRQLLATHPGSTVIALEAAPDAAARCRENLDLWNESQRLARRRPRHGDSAVIQAAAWMENGRVRLGGPTPSRRRIFETGTAERPSTPLAEVVPSMTLATIVQRVLDERRPSREVIDYLHIDAVGIAGPVFEWDLRWLRHVEAIRVHVDAPGDPARVLSQVQAFGMIARECPVHTGSVVAWSRRAAGRSAMHGPRAESQLRAEMPPI